MKPKYFIGVDISKLTLDIAVLHAKDPILSFKIENSQVEVKQFLTEIKKAYGFKNKEVAFCAEHMGIYANFLLDVLNKKKIPVYLESPLRIKRSLGIIRGKNDRIDAIRIASYAKKNYQTMKVWQPQRECIEQLKRLYTIRKRLVKIKTMLTNNEKDTSYYLTKTEADNISENYSVSKMAIKLDINNIEEKMLSIIQADDKLKRLFEVITSVPCIGKVIATILIVQTNEFLDFDDAKHFASFCGIAPFEYSSGTSVRGKTKVSYLANKEIKKMLHIAVLGLLRNPKHFLTRYYLRKIDEGKHKMSVFNAMRNKLLSRVFACVRNDKVFKEI